MQTSTSDYLETPVPDDNECAIIDEAESFYKRIDQLSNKTPKELRADYVSLFKAGKIYFFQEYEIFSHEMLPYLPELEAVPTVNPFEKFQLPQSVRKRYNIPDGEATYQSLWNHDNLGEEARDLGATANGKQRRKVFGLFFTQIKPPTLFSNNGSHCNNEDAVWGQFENDPKDSRRYKLLSDKSGAYHN